MNLGQWLDPYPLNLCRTRRKNVHHVRCGIRTHDLPTSSLGYGGLWKKVGVGKLVWISCVGVARMVVVAHGLLAVGVIGSTAIYSICQCVILCQVHVDFE